MKAEKMYAMSEAPCCEEQVVHADKVQFVNENMPSEDKLYDLAELFKLASAAAAQAGRTRERTTRRETDHLLSCG